MDEVVKLSMKKVSNKKGGHWRAVQYVILKEIH